MSRARRFGVLSAAAMLAAVGGWPAGAADRPSLATAVNPDSVPLERRTPQGLYVTAREAHAAVQSRADVLLIDVRTPGETVFSGLATAMTRNIPYLVIEDGHAFDAGQRRYKLVANPDFPKAVAQLLAGKKLGPEAVLILYCSVGERSAKAAALLAASGYSQVYSMIDGFNDDTRTGGGAGWKGAGLPWGYELSAAQAYHSPSF